MKLPHPLPLLAALALAPLAFAATPTAPGATAPALSEAQRAALEKEHKLAVMNVSFAGETQQIIFELFPDDAPKTVANFIQNVEKGTYNGLAFHRAIADYLVQTGDPATKDNGNRNEWGLGEPYTIPGEFKLPHRIGAVAMARRSDKVNPDRKSNGTQFYFALGNLSALNGKYSVFGEVVSGLDTLKAISRSIRDTNDTPIERIEITDIKIIDHKGPVVKLTNSAARGDRKRRGVSKPDSLKNPFEKFLDRVW